MFIANIGNKEEIFKFYLDRRSRDSITVICPYCKKLYGNTKHHFMKVFNSVKTENAFCSRECKSLFEGSKIKTGCAQCNKEVFIRLAEKKKSKSGLSFCSHSCSCTYNMLHKTTGIRRSKLEVWLEEKLPILYPDVKFMFNDKTTINSELDIYLPKYKLAFELNGIFHYEPIYGKDKLNQIQNNDSNKFQKCQENQISLCIIDTSWIKYNKESNFQRILDIVSKIIQESV